MIANRHQQYYNVGIYEKIEWLFKVKGLHKKVVSFFALISTILLQID